MKTKGFFYLIGIVALILAVASPALAQETGSPQAPDAIKMYLPVVSRPPLYTLSGQIKDAQDLPLSGALVTNGQGGSVKTDNNGVYTLKTNPGAQTLTASKDGYTFEPATADLSVSEDMLNLNFTALSPADVQWWWPGCTTTNLLINSNFEGTGGWTITPANNPSLYTTQYSWSGVWSMLSGVPMGIPNPFPNQFTTSEFWQPTTTVIPANAWFVRLRMRVLPISDQRFGYHIAEQAAMDAAVSVNAPEAAESQYAHVRDETNTVTLRQLFKWFPIDTRFWLFRSYDLRDFRGQTISILFGAANDGDARGNTALYVDDVFLDVCVP